MTTTYDLLSIDTWRALADEYLEDTEDTTAPVCRTGRDFNTSQPWYELLDHVQANTTWLEAGTNYPDEVITSLHGHKLVWEAREDADTIITCFEDLQAWAAPRDFGQNLRHVPLSDLHHDHPIFDRQDNLRFRAWHDTAHLAHGLGFTATEELRLYGLQARELPSQARDALFCESVYQLSAAVQLGTFPDRQYCRKLGPVGRAVRDLLIGLS